MNSNEDNNYKNDLFVIFIDKLVTLYVKRKYDELENILIGKENDKRTYRYSNKSSNGAKYIDNDSIIVVRPWTDNETKRLIEALHYVCFDDFIKLRLSEKIVKLWLYNMNTEMNQFFFSCGNGTDNKIKRIKCDEEHRLTLKIEKKTWSEFVKRCEILGITTCIGFKNCIEFYIEQKANTCC